MRLKLTLKDYKKLWLLMTPEEIKKEFEDYSHSPRQIRNYYQDFGVSKAKRAKKELLEEIEKQYPWHPGTLEVTEEILQEIKSQAIQEVWTSLREFI